MKDTEVGFSYSVCFCAVCRRLALVVLYQSSNNYHC